MGERRKRQQDEHRREEMERDAEIRRQTNIGNAMGPIEGTDAERSAADESGAADEALQEGGSRARRTERDRPGDEEEA